MHIISRGIASMAVSAMVGTAKREKNENMQFGIFVIVDAQEINLRENL